MRIFKIVGTQKEFFRLQKCSVIKFWVAEKFKLCEFFRKMINVYEDACFIFENHYKWIRHAFAIKTWVKKCLLSGNTTYKTKFALFSEWHLPICLGDLRLAKNNWSLTLTSRAVKFYNALVRNGIEPKIENIGRTKIYPRCHRFSLSVEFLNVYVQNTIYRLRRGLWLHTQRKDGANTTRLRPTQRSRHSYNDAI